MIARRTYSYAFFLTLALAALVALPAWAEEEAGKPGLPQLDTSHYPEQLFWLAVTFITLYLLMAYVALPRVKNTQDKRKSVIAEALDAAKAANNQALAAAADADKALAEARAKAQMAVAAIKADAAKVSAEQQAVQGKQLAQKLQEAEARIAAVRDAALKDALAAANDLATTIVDSVTKARA